MKCPDSHKLALNLIETPFDTLANRADPDQAAPMSCLIRVHSVCLWICDISGPTQVDLKRISLYHHESLFI